MNEAYNFDCLDYMKTLPDNAFDLACVDPPFGDAMRKQEKREQGAHYVGRGRQKRYAEAYESEACSQTVQVEREAV